MKMTVSLPLLLVACQSATKPHIERSMLDEETVVEPDQEWVLVEEDARKADLVPYGAEYRQGARVLVLKRWSDPGECDEWALNVELARNPGPARIGEEIEAFVWIVDADPTAIYEVQVKPGRTCVQVLSSATLQVHGREKVSIRFTSFGDGSAGIRVCGRKVNVKVSNAFDRAAPREPR